MKGAKLDLLGVERFPDARVAQNFHLQRAFRAIARVDVAGISRMTTELGQAWRQVGQNRDQRLDRDRLVVGSSLWGLAIEVTAVLD